MDSFKIVRGPPINLIGGGTQQGEFLFVVRLSDNASVPFDPDNRDTRIFLFLWIAGAVVTRPNGNPYPYTLPHRTQLRLDTTVPLNPDEP